MDSLTLLNVLRNMKQSVNTLTSSGAEHELQHHLLLPQTHSSCWGKDWEILLCLLVRQHNKSLVITDLCSSCQMNLPVICSRSAGRTSLRHRELLSEPARTSEFITRHKLRKRRRTRLNTLLSHLTAAVNQGEQLHFHLYIKNKQQRTSGLKVSEWMVYCLHRRKRQEEATDPFALYSTVNKNTWICVLLWIYGFYIKETGNNTNNNSAVYRICKLLVCFLIVFYGCFRKIGYKTKSYLSPTFIKHVSAASSSSHHFNSGVSRCYGDAQTN